ncbi:MAG: hypothetical protein HY677_02730, partial [Chloroflexi bacterium]|nr:hypothetical protein [Chloroflexota bacterium]
MARRSWFLVALAIVTLLVIALVGGLRLAGPAGAQVSPASLAAIKTGLGVTVAVSTPANGSFFVAGERAVVTVTLKDDSGAALIRDDFATLGLYAYGPQETTKTVTASKLLNATTDRSKTPHHYIDLLKDTNVQVAG